MLKVDGQETQDHTYTHTHIHTHTDECKELAISDLILKVDGQETQGHSIQQVSALFWGNEGTPCELTILRSGSLPRTITVIRKLFDSSTSPTSLRISQNFPHAAPPSVPASLSSSSSSAFADIGNFVPTDVGGLNKGLQGGEKSSYFGGKGNNNNNNNNNNNEFRRTFSGSSLSSAFADVASSVDAASVTAGDRNIANVSLVCVCVCVCVYVRVASSVDVASV